ncbi:class D sortase [Sporosarcina sp. G11-34]|uniref:class D sortase n=1 Tax=Sporosarcina sp. G11-34 TaxID=2849605 RepID=UPI0022A9D3A0|nr:class D sortase [Sporosarcina sp. G11-34]MCZ2260680.1 class D sortase [Sporosarcina sp. G11-34]
MRKVIPILFIVIGALFIIYAGGQFATSYFEQEKNLEEAKGFISEEVIPREESDEIEVYSDIKEGDSIGVLYIPRLDREIPIISGTHEDELARGVGHFISTALPGQQDQILLSGHRDTVFRQFGELEHGDEIHVKMEKGTFIYTIFDTEIVDADDRTVIRSTAPEEILTLSTCYPFTFIGSAPDRYIIYAK